MAWRIAAHEAAASGYRFIEKEHLLIGIASIEKVVADGPDKAELARNWFNHRISKPTGSRSSPRRADPPVC
ncbi:MAG: hypothetical protein HZA17_09855 [Nitrospirae bacterium]|nr:hypothetical protein [Nitrospirota bacterium]